ncbi:hypothetical protein WKW80_32655 [Variovorax humicola]|uniref:Uncharacterized protein n=1 Tax=Variovorax humicola TaxID=1769758 RepID=A0ABU8W9I4_9BURK
MTVLNHLDRFHLAAAAIDRVATHPRARQPCAAAAARQAARTPCMDPPPRTGHAISGWRWQASNP